MKEDEVRSSLPLSQPLITVFDITRDVKGFFFAPATWQNKYQELKKELERVLGSKLLNNGNSFNSCF